MNTLYTTQASLYARFADDRDFAAECALFLNSWRAIQTDNPRHDWNALELFAGPAFHAGALSEWTDGGQVRAIDQSSDMRVVAIRDRGIAPSNYALVSLPGGLCQLPWREEGLAFDLVLATRFSLGLLPPDAVENLLVNLQRLLRPEALLIFELHSPTSLLESFDGEALRMRTSVVDGETWTCWWPSEAIHWDGQSPRVRMKIELHNGKGDVLTTESDEWIHTIPQLDALCQKIGGYSLMLQSRSSFAINRNATFCFIRRTH